MTNQREGAGTRREEGTMRGRPMTDHHPGDELARALSALRYIADAENWHGDPTSHDALLFGHDTPYELARAALSDTPTPGTPPTPEPEQQSGREMFDALAKHCGFSPTDQPEPEEGGRPEIPPLLLECIESTADWLDSDEPIDEDDRETLQRSGRYLRTFIELVRKVDADRDPAPTQPQAEGREWTLARYNNGNVHGEWWIVPPEQIADLRRASDQWEVVTVRELPAEEGE